jgi:hypothetical protein
VSWFRRGRKVSDDPVSWVEEGAADGADPAATLLGADQPVRGGGDSVAGAVAGAEGADPEPGQPAAVRSGGPWDSSEVDGPAGYVDLGGLWLPGRDGMELRLEIEQDTSRVIAATIQLEGSAVQLQAFAAPRTEGIWPEIRQEIAAGVTQQGGTADEVSGSFGTELLARIPSRTPEGRTVHQPARFAGVDGPRWFLRAVFHGAAAYQPDQAQELEALVRQVVVVRGGEAMAPRELLPLRLPNADDEDAVEPGTEQDHDPLNPFERGPEITEVR